MNKFIAFLKNNFYMDIVFAVVFIIILAIPFCQCSLNNPPTIGETFVYTLNGNLFFFYLDTYINFTPQSELLVQGIFFIIGFLIIAILTILSIFLKKLRIYFYSSIAVGYLTIFAIFSDMLGVEYSSSGTPHVGYFLTLICLIWYITAFIFLLIDFVKNKKSTPMQDTNATA